MMTPVLALRTKLLARANTSRKINDMKQIRMFCSTPFKDFHMRESLIRKRFSETNRGKLCE